LAQLLAINGARGSATILFAQRKFYLYCTWYLCDIFPLPKKVKDRFRSSVLNTAMIVPSRNLRALLMDLLQRNIRIPNSFICYPDLLHFLLCKLILSAFKRERKTLYIIIIKIILNRSLVNYSWHEFYYLMSIFSLLVNFQAKVSIKKLKKLKDDSKFQWKNLNF